MTVTAFAESHHLSKHAVYKVLDGKHIGMRGAAHKAAVALGMKANETDQF